MMLNEDDILDRIYEAAVVPTTWPDLLEGFSERIGALGALLLTLHNGASGWISSPRLAPLFDACLTSCFVGNNLRARQGLEKEWTGFTVADHELFTPEEMEADPLYAFLRSQGAGWCAGSIIDVPSGDRLVLSFEGAAAKGPFSRETVAYIETFRPHFARAALLSSRLGVERARSASEAMRVIGLAAAVVGRSKRLFAANELFDPLMPAQVQEGARRVQLADRQADALFCAALDRIQMQGTVADTFSLPVPAAEENPAFVLHVVPVRRAANDIFSDASCLIVATPLFRKAAPSASLLNGLFDLTAAEARLARGLANGGTVSDLAQQLCISPGTLRAQLKSVFAKTGLSRQSDLVALLGGLTLSFQK